MFSIAFKLHTIIEYRAVKGDVERYWLNVWPMNLFKGPRPADRAVFFFFLSGKMDPIPVYLTPHKISLIILVKHYLTDSANHLSVEDKQKFGLFLLDEITVQYALFHTNQQQIKHYSEPPLQEFLSRLEDLQIDAENVLFDTVGTKFCTKKLTCKLTGEFFLHESFVGVDRIYSFMQGNITHPPVHCMRRARILAGPESRRGSRNRRLWRKLVYSTASCATY